ncbi:MAG: NAD-dependent epimerase/dehydratase family protein, partial [Candidatus Thermoplasmatota archaeon]|nr:NAD-dependent epimerase/dehydratase family protein [Candidatus Thermoplasmatota archaeon]
IQSVKDPARDAANLEASKAIFKDAVDAGVKRILFSSSGGTVYGDKPSVPSRETDPTRGSIPYTRTKLEIERDLLDRCEGADTLPLILRYANPYGPNQYPSGGTGVVTAWLESARDGRPITLYGDGETARDFVYVSDAASAALGALTSERARGVYNVGTGLPVSLNALLKTVEQVVGKRLEINRLPPRSSDVVRTIALDSTRAYLDFGWRPEVSLDEGVARTWEWVRSGEKFTIG